MQELHNELIAPDSEGGLGEATNSVTSEVITINTILRNIIP